MLRAILAAVTLSFAALAAGPSSAQDYPTRTITLVVPYPPGGGVDAMARIVAEFVLIVFRINEHLGAIRNQGGFRNQ